MIKSTGISGNAQKDIIVIVYDIDAVVSNLSKSLAANQNTNPNSNQNNPTTPPTPTPNTPPPNNTTNNTQPSSGLPTIVYWYEP